MMKSIALCSASVGCLAAMACTTNAIAQDQPARDFHVDVSLEAVVLTREHTNDFTIVQDTVTGDPILTSDDIGFGWEPGVDARLGASLGSFGITGRFFGGFEWEESISATTTPIWNFPTIPPLFGLGVANLDVDYDTELHSGELDLSYVFSGNVKVFAGARGLYLGEELSVAADFGGNQATITTTANTFGIGPQAGAMVTGNVPGLSRVFIDGELRGGYLFLDSDLDFDVVQGIGPAFAASGNPDGETLFAEAGLSARFQITENIGIRAGYNVLFVDEIPTAPSSISSVNVVDATIGSSSDQLLVHGVRFGVVGRF